MPEYLKTGLNLLPISSEWASDEKCVLLRRFWDDWDHSDVHQAIDATLAMLNQVSHTVDVIGDFSSPQKADPTRLISAIRRYEKEMPGNLGYVVLVKTDTFVQTLVKINKLNAPRIVSRIHLANTMSEAYALLDKLHRQDSRV